MNPFLHQRDLYAGFALHALLTRAQAHDLHMDENLEALCRAALEIGEKMEKIHGDMEKRKYHLPNP